MLWLTYVSLQTADLTQSERCPRQADAGNGEVVVCGRRNEHSPYRIGPQPSTPPTLPDAQFNISDGVKVGVQAEQGEVGGIPTNRAMISLKIKF